MHCGARAGLSFSSMAARKSWPMHRSLSANSCSRTELIPGKIEVIGSAVDLQKFKPPRDRMKFRHEMGFRADTPVIGNIGMIRPDKGQLILVEAAHFILAERPMHALSSLARNGSAEARHQCKECHDRAGLAEKIIMTGYRWDTPTFMPRATCGDCFPAY